MKKSEVYSWRLSPRLKTALEEAAHARGKSVADLLDQIARHWLSELQDRGAGEEERQQRLRAAAMRSIGAIQGDDPHWAENAGSEVRSRLSRRHGRPAPSRP